MQFLSRINAFPVLIVNMCPSVTSGHHSEQRRLLMCPSSGRFCGLSGIKGLGEEQ